MSRMNTNSLCARQAEILPHEMIVGTSDHQSSEPYALLDSRTISEHIRTLRGIRVSKTVGRPAHCQTLQVVRAQGFLNANAANDRECVVCPGR